MHAVEKDLASMRLTMQGLLVVAEKTGRVIPAAAKHLFEGTGRDRARLKTCQSIWSCLSWRS